MYLDFYGLKYEPFSLSPDPRFLYLAASHKEALAHLRYGLIQHKGFVVIIGEVGTGKTTLIHSLLAVLPQKVISAFISNPTLTRDEFFYWLGQKYGLGDVKNKADFLVKFTRFLEKARKEKKNVVLIIDEAHCLKKDILEEIRLLSNLETPESKLINIILTGQPEFNDILNDPNLRALRQRITLKYDLKPLDLKETKAYVQLRMAKAGAKDVGIFSEAALNAVHKFSGGIPRVINLVCDHALLTGFVKEARVIDEDIIKECIKDIEGEKGKNGSKSTKSGIKRIFTHKKYILIGGLLFFWLSGSILLLYMFFFHTKEGQQVLERILQHFR